MQPTPYGIKALRQMREKRKPSERLTRKITQTHDYFLEKVDPIVSGCITFLLCAQPADIPRAIIEYLYAKKENMNFQPKVGENLEGRPRKELKVFLAISIGPIIAKLVNRIALERPVDVIEFMINEVQTMVDCPVEPPLQQSAPQTAPSSSAAPAPVAPPSVSNNQEERHIQIAVLGLGGAGKSSILNMLQGKYDPKIRPTIGFRPVSMMLSEETKVRFYDLGGGKKIRDIWSQYFHDVHGIIYVVDSATPEEEVQACLDTFSNTVNNEYLAGKPLMVLANKQDVQDARSVYDLQELMRPLSTGTEGVEFFGCSAHVDPEAEAVEADPRIEACLLRLFDQVNANFHGLNSRVQADSKRKAEEEVAKRIAKERKVLKNKIASAFVASADPEYIAAHQIEAEPENVFSQEDGLIYLASEIGEDVEGLTDMAKQVAEFVGYQKLALTIIGGLKTPVSKKKTPMEWPEIHALVSELRSELGVVRHQQ